MAAPRETTAPRIALAALSAAAAIGLVRVFADSGWLVAAVLAAVLPHAAFAYAERRRWGHPMTLFVVVAGGALFTMIVVEAHTTFFGIPTAATLRAFFDDLGLASSVLRSAIVPVTPEGPALALALVSIWLVATTADRLAWRLDATLGALGPSLVLFVAVAALGEGAHWPTTFLYGAAAAAFLFTEHYAEMLERRTWFHLADARRSGLVTGGVIAAVVATTLALVVGPLLPGARGEALFDYRSLGDKGRGSDTWRTITPLVDIRSRVIDPSDAELFTVQASRGAYWRLVALDTFDGKVFGLESQAPRAGGQLPTTVESPRSTELVQQVDIGPYADRWLPAAYRAVDIEGIGDARVIPESLSLVSETPTSDSTTYTVVSQVPTPTTEELEASHFVGRGRLPREVALPDDFPERVTRLAEQVAGAEQTPYEQALALQHFLRNSGEFTYDTNVEAGHSDDALERFLFDIQRGYCEQFAVSFAAMARSIGLPTRVAMGFTAGRQDANGVFHVSNKDAHAWPEVWLEGIGWMPFEPTPTRFEPTPGDPTGTGREAPPSDNPASSTTAAPSTTSTTNGGGATATTVNPFRPNNENIDVGGGGTTSGGDSTWTRVLVGMGILLALVLLAVVATLLTVLIVKWQRRHRRRYAANPRDRVTGAWAEALDRLREAGVSPRDSATPVEFALRHAAAHGAGSAGPPLMELARLQTAALFAPEPPSTEEADDAWQQVGRIEHALRRVTNRSHRWQRRLDPRSLRLSPRAG